MRMHTLCTGFCTDLPCRPIEVDASVNKGEEVRSSGAQEKYRRRPLQKINGARTSTRIHIRPRSVLDPVLGARHEHARALTLRALAQRGEARCVASAMRGRSE